MITFCFDQVADQYTGYPNLARWLARPYTDEWRQYEQHWPYTVPCRLLLYFRHNDIPFRVATVDTVEYGFYPVAFGWFDFSCDYINLLSETVKERCRQKKIKLLFYYHEGDNPARIKQQLDNLCCLHQLPDNSYIFISANTATDRLSNSMYFGDHEFFFRHLNRSQSITDTSIPRLYDFTLLSRTHKWWRASCVADLANAGLLNNSQWSYQTEVTIDDAPDNNPLELDSIDGWRGVLDSFVNNGPYVCDQFDPGQQNDHHWVNLDLYTKSHVHIVLETHFDADQSDGSFITEKTYKCIKYAQPFVVVGPAGTLAQLRKDGYRVFDGIIDNSYDEIKHNTQRWLALKKSLLDIGRVGSETIFQQCQEDVKFNQQFFLDRSRSPLNTLQRKLLCLNQ